MTLRGLVTFAALAAVVFLPSGGAALADPVPYTLNPGDEIRITAYEDPRLDRELVVLPDGTISYPVVGEIQASGLTVSALAGRIADNLVQRGFLQEGAVLDASVTRTTGYTLYVIGQVQRPGSYITLSNIDVMQALSLAGGLTPFASKRSIKVLRNENGAQVALPFHYGAVEDGRDLASNIMLRPGDTVVVPD